jgi:hypothetical protein
MKQRVKVLVFLIGVIVVAPLLAQAPPPQAGSSSDKQEAMAKLQKMSAELSLTPQQKKQMMPILMEEGQKMKATKSDTSLPPLQKMSQMRQIGSDMDAKVKPILSTGQYQKYEQMRAQEREQMMEKMRSGKGQ